MSKSQGKGKSSGKATPGQRKSPGAAKRTQQRQPGQRRVARRSTGRGYG